MDKQKLEPTIVTDEAVITKCKEVLNKWSASLSFSATKQLGTDAQFVSAKMFHAYGLFLSTTSTHREFVREKGGTPKANPTDIADYDIWDIKGLSLEGEYKKELSDTCKKDECEECSGNGITTCDSCDGSGKETCSKCDGSGEVKCSECGGIGEKWCSSCRGGGKIGIFEPSGLNDKKRHCTRCGGTGKETCRKCHGSQTETCKKCRGSGQVTCSRCGGRGEIKCNSCDGRGWNSYTYHLIQKQKTSEFKKTWGDEGLRELLEYDKYQNCIAQVLSAKDESGLVPQDIVSQFESPFMDDLRDSWTKACEGENPANDKVTKQHAELKSINALVKYQYRYQDSDYDVWIDLSTGKVYESGAGGLMIDFWYEANKEFFLEESKEEIQKKIREVPTDKLFALKIRKPKTIFGITVSPLGWIGIHRFLLGQKWLGFLEMLCFLLWPVRLVWWLIELFSIKKSTLKSNGKKVLKCKTA